MNTEQLLKPVQRSERVIGAGGLLLAGLLAWQAAGVLGRARDRERAVTGVTAEWLAEANDVDALAVLARQREAAGDAAGVVELTRRVVLRRPLDAENRLRLALALAAQGEHGLARRHAERAARIARNHPELLLYSARTRLRAWEDEGDLGALEDALRHFRDALQRDARLLARVHDMLGQSGLATPANLAAVVPDTPAAWREAGRLFAQQEQWEAAADAYRRAGAAGEVAAVSALARAQAEARAGRPAAALAAASQAVDVAAPSERARVMRSAIHLLRGLPAGFVGRGEALCFAWAQRWPSPPTALFELAEWRLARRDDAGALEIITQLPAAARESPDGLDLRGRAVAAAGRPEVAEDYFRRALQRQRERPARWLRLMHWLEGRGRIDDALKLADQAQQRHPDDAAIAATRDRLVGRSVGIPPGK